MAEQERAEVQQAIAAILALGDLDFGDAPDEQAKRTHTPTPGSPHPHPHPHPNQAALSDPNTLQLATEYLGVPDLEQARATMPPPRPRHAALATMHCHALATALATPAAPLVLSAAHLPSYDGCTDHGHTYHGCTYHGCTCAALHAASRRCSRRRSSLYLSYISPASPLHLPCISPASPLHLHCISPASARRCSRRRSR